MAFGQGQLIDNRYRVVRMLSQGGLGTTYLAEVYGRQVMIETRPRTAGQSGHLFQREIDVLRGLDHPNILRLLSSGIDADANTPYLVFAYAPKGSLRERHPHGSQVPLSTVVEYVDQAASALQYIHDRGIVHRDVKPENMLVGRNDEVLLADFGVATILKDSADEEREVLGTPIYMAPEQFRGKAVPASDQYELGVVTYQWLTGAFPFHEGNPIQLAYQHTFEPPPLLTPFNPTIPVSTERVVLQALEKQPEMRFRTVREFALALESSFQSSRFNLPGSFAPPAGAGGAVPPPAGGAVPHLDSLAPPPQIKERRHAPLGTSPLERASASFEDTGDENEDMVVAHDAFLPMEDQASIELDWNQMDIDPSGDILPHPAETQLSLYALARAQLEADDRALVGKRYMLEAGIAQERPEQFVGEPFKVTVQDPTEPLLFQVLIHTSPNIALLGEWYQSLLYSPLSVAPQLITCPFRLTTAGESYLLVNFYRERQWLKSIRLEFEGSEQARFSIVERRR